MSNPFDTDEQCRRRLELESGMDEHPLRYLDNDWKGWLTLIIMVVSVLVPICMFNGACPMILGW